MVWKIKKKLVLKKRLAKAVRRYVERVDPTYLAVLRVHLFSKGVQVEWRSKNGQTSSGGWLFQSPEEAQSWSIDGDAIPM